MAYTIEEAKLEFINKGYKPQFDTYIECRKNLLAKTEDGYFITISLDNLKRGHTPNIFGESNPHTLYNIQLWCEINKKTFKLIDDKYINNRLKLKWKCLKKDCGEIFEADWGNISQGNGCSYCNGKKAGLSNCLATKNPELIKEWDINKNGNLTPYDVTCGSEKRIWWKCCICNFSWNAFVIHRSKGEGCPKCNKSKGEKTVLAYLMEHNINFNSQYRFKDCKNKKPLPFDFAIFDDNNLQFLVEYDGELHYERRNDYHGGKEGLLKQQNNDSIQNNIPLLRIPYWEFNNIESILNNFLFNFNQIKIKE
jgi:hypothetical protein